jgi:hypothetical protein
MKPLTRLAIFAVLGQVVLLASAWILPLASEYHLVSDNISELALGRYGLVLTLALGISGLGVIGLSYAIRQLTAGTPRLVRRLAAHRDLWPGRSGRRNLSDRSNRQQG